MKRMLLRLVPATLSTRLARHAVPILVGAIGAILVLTLTATALVSPGALGITAARVSDTTSLDAILSSGLQERDTDRDGLSDSLENYVYGTDPENWDTAGIGIPDGWLVQFGFDPLDPLTREARGRAPATADLPATYAAGYPREYTPPLSVYYAYGRPADHRAGVDAPWWRNGPHADPVAADPTGTGLPIGWLLHHGIPLENVQPERVASGSVGNLTLRQAFEQNTDPLESDTDGDGLSDWTEIHLTRTDPARYSTARTGIADGWLVRYGLDPFDPRIATQDTDRDGLTNFEEFQASLAALREDVAARGISALFGKGLHPLEWQTAQTGIPDGWYVRYGLSPFGEDLDRVIGRASDFDEFRDWTPDGFDPLPDITFTVRGAYEYARPDDWNESAKGVWWGGTNPVTLDSDGDGLPDPVEIRGWYANVTFETGPEAKPRVYRATSNPLEGDSDGDGFTDLEEYRGRSECGGTQTRTFPPTDPRNRDTAFSGLSDLEKVCGVVRGDATYDLGARGTNPGLDPTRADSAGDLIKDGQRVDFWHERAEALRANPRYPYPTSAYRTVFEWTEKYARFSGLSRDETLAAFRPDGDIDGDGLVNVVDPDPSGGLYAEKYGDATTARTKIYFLGGPQIDPSAYRFTEFASPVPHSATDPANPDTDGDGLPDSWETRYGRFDPTRGSWDLDPAKADSDADGITDDKANNDGDIVTWYSFESRGANNERTTHTFEFTNDLEFLANTDPNAESTSEDGVPDGWKAFWGSRIAPTTYPNLVAGRDASIGSIALARASDIETAVATSGITPTANLRGVGAKSTGYVRLVNVSSCSADLAPILRTGERLADANACYSGTNLENQAIRIARVYGVSVLTYADESRLRTNPFLSDTDGDGAPDAYEAHWLVRTPGGSAYPDPAVDDSAKDPDGDGLGIMQECGSLDGARCGFETFVFADKTYGAGANPHATDTDGDGIQDGIEAGALINPLDPSDIESFAVEGKDTDRDGVPDFQELTGTAAKVFFGEPIRTNPKDPDTDGDGLLDGHTINLDPVRPADALLMAEWKARGIAHDPQANGTVNFLGERDYGPPFGVRPDRIDSGVSGVPDGWLAYYNQNPNERTVDADSYLARRPTWWLEARHGVWWWGDVPGVPAPDDADGDGLHDLTGEDPFPASNRLNRVIDGNLTITDPVAVEAWVLGLAPDAQRARAQRVGDGAGDPKTARASAVNLVDPATNVRVREMRACVAILDASAPAIVEKGIAFPVTGRVVLDERTSGTCGQGLGELLEGSANARIGLANRTVLVSVFSPGVERIVGAGFTDANGTFNLTANITERQRYTIPRDGLVLLGRISGIATSTFDPTQLATGPNTGTEQNRLVVWVYNTSSTAAPGDATFSTHKARIADVNGVVAERTVHATRFASAPAIPVTVRSATRLAFEIADDAQNGERLTGEIRLADASGAPLIDKQVIVRWDGAPGGLEYRNLSTDRDGRVNITRVGIPIAVTAANDRSLTATFTSSDPDLLGSNATHRVRVRDPTALTATLERTALTVGENAAVSGTLTTVPVALPDGSSVPSAPVEGASVTLDVGGAQESATTDRSGRFTVRIGVPGSLAAGNQNVRVSFAGTDAASPSSATLELQIKRTASITGLNRIEGPRTIEVTMRGRLVDNEGLGFAGRVEVHSERAGMLVRGNAANDGNFVLFVPLHALDLGTQPLRVVYPGDAGHAPAENFTQARVTSTTRLTITQAPDVLVRGQNFAIRALLTDDSGKPIAGQPVAAFWRGERTEVIVTDPTGNVSFIIPTNASERPASGSLGLDYSPSATSVYQPARASHTIRVVAGVTLELADASVPRGAIPIGGRLLDDEGRPLPGSAIIVTFDGGRVGEARTSRNGSFEILHVLPDDAALGSHRVSARFAGTAALANVTTEATWHIRSALTLDLTRAGPFIRGETAPLEGRLHDDRGALVASNLRIEIADREIDQQRVLAGNLRATLTLPADLPRGTTTLRVSAPATDHYDAFRLDVPIIVKIRPTVEIELPAIAIRGFAIGGGVTLKDDNGEPLRNTSYAYAIGSGKGAVVGATDADGEGAVAGVAPLAGDGVLALTVRGGPDVVAAQYSTNTMRVVGPATPVGYAILVIVVLAALILGALIVAAVILRRRQLQEAREILDEAIRELLAGNEYAGTIFLAYRRFAAYLARHGFAEKASDTPREFAVGVRKALPIGATPLRALIGLFEEARYSDHPIGSSERDRAVESLATVRNELDTIIGNRKVTS